MDVLSGKDRCTDRQADMMYMKIAFLLANLLVPGLMAEDDHTSPGCYGNSPVKLLVYNSLTNSPNVTYISWVANRGSVFGAMKRLQDTSAGFNFTYTKNSDYGPFLESINGVSGDKINKTYWELLVKMANGTTFTPDVGIGCYIPTHNQEIIFKYKNY